VGGMCCPREAYARPRTYIPILAWTAIYISSIFAYFSVDRQQPRRIVHDLGGLLGNPGGVSGPSLVYAVQMFDGDSIGDFFHGLRRID